MVEFQVYPNYILTGHGCESMCIKGFRTDNIREYNIQESACGLWK